MSEMIFAIYVKFLQLLMNDVGCSIMHECNFMKIFF